MSGDGFGVSTHVPTQGTIPQVELRAKQLWESSDFTLKGVQDVVDQARREVPSSGKKIARINHHDDDLWA